MAPDERRGGRSPALDDGDESQEQSTGFDGSFSGEDRIDGEERRRLSWRALNVLLFIGCAVAAVLFILAASLVKV